MTTKQILKFAALELQLKASRERTRAIRDQQRELCSNNELRSTTIECDKLVIDLDLPSYLPLNPTAKPSLQKWILDEVEKVCMTYPEVKIGTVEGYQILASGRSDWLATEKTPTPVQETVAA